eukprot:TRINITY_DN102203_c0_g1_i1.p1 TRINITY_DN102203_c0_g1~~TRINITY_DN102203_c0_g1_i1.p1  ORF type:complete len:334 (+),score=42.89 TRINITY_DN102203_c0_g1_i1:223-1224(+)
MAGGGGKDNEKASKEKAPPGRFTLAMRRACRDAVLWVDWGIDAGMGVFHIVMKILGPCMICLALSLIGFCTYSFFYHWLPGMDVLGVSGRLSLSALGLFLEFNALYNYGMAIFGDPGTPPEYEEAVKEQQAQGGEEDGLKKPKLRPCTRCTKVKPPRTHHCSICRKCVLKMDHHCPWVNNCVGHNNYRHFCLFLLFLFLVCSFICAVFFEQFSEMMFFYRRRSRFTRNGRQCIMTSFMICGSIMVALSILGGFHVYLVLTNQTTIEFQTNLIKRREARKNGEFYRNPYDVGRTRNFVQVFGPSPFFSFRWMLPFGYQPPSGDGMSFPSIRLSE